MPHPCSAPSSPAPSFPTLFNLEYKPLDENEDEIRVIKFLNLSSTNLTEEEIQCSIKHVSLKDPPRSRSNFEFTIEQESRIFWDPFTECVDLRDSNLERTEISKAATIARGCNISHPDFRYTWGDFEALSYTWGNKKDTKEIKVDGKTINVPRNLEEALRALRDLEETRLGMLYWVDSLCINQNDKNEKETQIKRMRDIYSQARAVVVSLGQAEAHDKLAVDTMLSFCRRGNVKEPSNFPEWLRKAEGSALSAFMNKPYWTRSWIIQELAMNHNSTLILCGKFKLTRRMIRLGVIYCQKLLQRFGDFSYQFDHNLDLIARPIASRVYRLISLTFDPENGVSLDRVLNLVRGADATYKVDKVYSIIGLLEPNISQDIHPDYSLSEQHVYTNFIKSVIEKSNGLQQILFGGVPTTEGWPSWVPDWRKPFGRHHIHHLRRSQASGQLSAKFRFIKNGKDYHLLACNGFQVDKVDCIAQETSTRWHSSQFSRASNRYGNTISGALQRTLLMDHPGVTKSLLLKIPWITDYDASLESTKWPKLFESTYAKKFIAFRENNKHFPIGGQTLQDFFPQSAKKNVKLLSTQRCLRLTMISLEQRVLITTETGYLGLAPMDVCRGDVVAIILGISCPVVLRPCSNGHYQIVGECYIHGLMNGEILDQGLEKQEFVLC